MRRIAASVTIMLSLSLFILGGNCAGPQVGGDCQYSQTNGKMIIRSIEATADAAEVCGSPTMVVLCDFVPIPEADAALAETGLQLGTRGGVVPTQAWLDAQSLTVGSEIGAVRGDIVSGTCSPVIFVVDTDESAEDVMDCE